MYTDTYIIHIYIYICKYICIYICIYIYVANLTDLLYHLAQALDPPSPRPHPITLFAVPRSGIFVRLMYSFWYVVCVDLSLCYVCVCVCVCVLDCLVPSFRDTTARFRAASFCSLRSLGLAPLAVTRSARYQVSGQTSPPHPT